MVVLIINYNRLILSKNTAEWCAAHGLEPIFIDNNSDYPPLLEYYAKCPFRVYRLKENRGHMVVSSINLKRELGIEGRFIVTDPDLDFTGIPDDFLDVLNTGLDKYPSIRKCGFSLEINDLPDSPEGKYIQGAHELSYWRLPLDSMYFDALIDTTFALHRVASTYHSVKQSLRTNRPYTARHIPWYYTDISLLSADEQYYYKTANGSASGKKRLMK